MSDVKLWQMTCIINLCNILLSIGFGFMLKLVQTILQYLPQGKGPPIPCHYSWLALLSWKHNFTPFPLSRVRPHILLAPDVYCHSIRPENYSKVN